MQKMYPCLWFDGKAVEASKFYVSTFKGSKMGAISYYDENSARVSGQKKGSVLTVSVKMLGLDFLLLNGGPLFKFTPAISFVVNCKDQKEIDYYWEKLSKGGSKSQCGWLTDKFGISWQITPSVMDRMMLSKDKGRVKRVMAAMLTMTKLDIKKLTDAYNSK